MAVIMYGCYQAMIIEYDDEFHFLKERPLDFPFKSSNKGFEAVAQVRRSNQDYVLALCEGNKCKSGSKGRKPGGGRVQVFEKKRKRWAHSRTIAGHPDAPGRLYMQNHGGWGEWDGPGGRRPDIGVLRSDDHGHTWRSIAKG